DVLSGRKGIEMNKKKTKEEIWKRDVKDEGWTGPAHCGSWEKAGPFGHHQPPCSAWPAATDSLGPGNSMAAGGAPRRCGMAAQGGKKGDSPENVNLREKLRFPVTPTSNQSEVDLVRKLRGREIFWFQ